MKNLFYLFLILFALGACGTKQEPKTIYVVRHAEKMLDGKDPMLSVAGTARAKKLDQILAEKEIKHAFSTNTVRTLATIQPIANRSGIAKEIYDPEYHEDLAQELRKRKGNIIVVGHSNTIHHLINHFVGTGQKYDELKEEEYDYIFEITLAEDGSSSVERKVYKEY
ncbi:SixA phosphatase family protein [Belliella kenyensis]|uniref:SixA phosphatase family protein n=1 Tax=Belliella kenyensis TaxID=1472724 RepID=A0ABV8EJ13_9BACT|nr:histidine phosphatase family protein [Belliella kenyensis]MCH7402380.1 histidine phosphatase family protein [Belliella kenyensis]MDN3603572.1 histidine phosphatase family protein [Belliella kenyensis]